MPLGYTNVHLKGRLVDHSYGMAEGRWPTFIVGITQLPVHQSTAPDEPAAA